MATDTGERHRGLAQRAAELARALGAKRSGRQWVCRCPAHEDSEPSLIFWDGESAIRFKCFAGCEPLDVIAALRRRGLWHESKTLNEHSSSASQNRDHAREIWRGARALDGTPAEYYLGLRGLSMPPVFNGSLARFHPACPRRSEHAPALVVLFRTLTDNVGCAVQRIFLTSDYRKDGKPMMLGPTANAAMKLGALTAKLTICEGFETALALYALGHAPVWALGSAGAIERFPMLKGVEELTIAADHDPVGLAAAHAVIERWGECRARGIMVDQPGADFADLARERMNALSSTQMH